MAINKLEQKTSLSIVRDTTNEIVDVVNNFSASGVYAKINGDKTQPFDASSLKVWTGDNRVTIEGRKIFNINDKTGDKLDIELNNEGTIIAKDNGDFKANKFMEDDKFLKDKYAFKNGSVNEDFSTKTLRVYDGSVTDEHIAIQNGAIVNWKDNVGYKELPLNSDKSILAKEDGTLEAKRVLGVSLLDVEDVIIGGTNLRKLSDYEVWESKYSASQDILNDREIKINIGLFYTNIGGAGSYNNLFPNIDFKPNTQYTFSGEMKTTATAFNGLNMKAYYTDGEVETIFADYYGTGVYRPFKFTSAKGKSITKIGCSYWSGGFQWLKDFKIEKGVVATDWSLAPEDEELKVMPRTVKLVDLRSWDPNVYHAVSIGMSQHIPYTITVSRPLGASYGVPSWSTHATGFSCMFKWESNGSAWGASQIKRTIYTSAQIWGSSSPVGGSINQLRTASLEYIYLRGGSKYRFEVEGINDASILPRNANYTYGGETLKAVANTVTAIVTDIDALKKEIEDLKTRINNL